MSLLTFTKKLSRKSAAKERSAEAQPADRQEKTGQQAAGRAGTLHPLVLMLEPLLSEKSVALQEQGVATFRVPWRVSKRQVALAVEQYYGVRVRRVRTVRVLPRKRRRGTTAGHTAAWKKAYVAVDDVQKIVAGP